MTDLVRKVLVIGGGFSGMSAAICLLKAGVEVDLVESDPNWTNYGAGISLSGATLRSFAELGVLEKVLALGSASDGVDIFTHEDDFVGQLQTPRIAGEGVPGNAAVMRPVLARVLADTILAAGADVRIGCTVKSLRQYADGVDVATTDGRKRRYDLVIGADGLESKTRELIFPQSPKPRYLGQRTWLAVLPRAAGLERTSIWFGPGLKAGVDPVDAHRMYLFLNENLEKEADLPVDQYLPILRAQIARFPSPRLQRIANDLDSSSRIIYKPLHVLMHPKPWYAGRVVLIGDAVHATTPHLASGVCMGVEDGIVLADELARGQSLPDALQSFHERRWERCRMVLENSARLGEIEVSQGDKLEHLQIMQDSFSALSAPI